MATISGTLRINDAFSNTLNRFNAGMQRSVAASNRLKSELNRGSGFNNLSNSANKATVSLRQMIAGSAIGGVISSAIGVAGRGMRSFVGELNESSIAWSTFEGNMRQIGKSPAQINAAKNSLQKFAQDTIYSSADMAATYSQLAAVGTKNTTQLVKGFGGLAAAANDPKQAMKTLSEQATQMAAKPMVQWQDFKLMLDQTPAGMAAVAKTMGMDTRKLLQAVQDKRVKTEDFLAAVAKTGTNANFSKMATKYKTVGQALDGLKETLANKVQPQFQKLSDIAIKSISNIADKLGNFDFTQIADTLIDNIKLIKKAGSDFVKGLTSTFNKNDFLSLMKKNVNSISSLFSKLTNNAGLKYLMTILGQNIGEFALSMARGISNVIQAISKMDPSALRALGAAFVALKFGANGLKLTAIATGLKVISSLNPGQIQHLATAITALASAFVAFKGMGIIGGFLTKAMSGITQALSAIPSIIGVIAGPIGWTLMGIGVLIVGAINAWQNNIFGFRNNMQNLFSNFDSVISPLKSAFSGLGEALAPASGALSAFGQVLGGISTVAIYGIAVGVGLLADALRNVVSVATAAVHQFRAIGDAGRGLIGAFNDIKKGDFSFSGMRRAFSDTGKDFKNSLSSFGQVGELKVTSGVISSLRGVDKQAKTTKSNLDSIKTPSITANNKALFDMSNIGAQKAKLSKSAEKDMQKLFNGAGNSKVKSGAEILSDHKIATPKVKPIKIKVAKPKVPQPTMPKMKPVKVKVAKPKVPQPTMPKMKTIPGPKIGRAKTGAFLASVTSAINQAAAIAQSGVGPMFSAGAMIGQGLAAGMQSAVGAVAAAANALVAQADRAARAKAKIHSPSRLFAEIGGFLGQGMAVGMDSTQGLIASSSDAMIATATPDAAGINYSPNGTPKNLVGARFGGNNTSTDDHSSAITIESGAIQINSTGTAEYDADRILEAIENRIMSQSEKALS
ncbi:tape measure protein [Lactobacillus apis]|uniref:tape measure protein n=1 Tax=Lactobacillus apis TaxID=303541 RepID=UPI00242A466E|nr:tape measure protein [Lactobacillus apis]